MTQKQRLLPSLYWIPSQNSEDPLKLAEIRPDTPEWAAQELHLFIVTDAGKPIYTRYGTIPTVSPIMCSWYAICSLMESLHEELDHFRAGSSTFVFLRKQSFIFIAVSKSALPASCLFKQLNYLYLLFLSLFSEHILTQISQKPSIDFRLYAEPNRPTWNGVINNMSEDPSFIFVPSIPVLCVKPEIRQIFSRSPSFSRLQSCKLSMLVKKNRVVAFGPHICDSLSLRLIIDLVWTPVFRDEEHWVPLYLRDSNKTNFLFTHNLKGTDYYIVMLCGGNQEMDTYHLVSVSLIQELYAATKNQEIVKPPLGAPDIFYFWAVNSLTYGQVFITDPDSRMLSDIIPRSTMNRSATLNKAPNHNQNSNQTNTQNTNRNANPNINSSNDQNANQSNNQGFVPDKNQNTSQNNDQISIQNANQNNDQNINQNNDLNNKQNIDQTTNSNNDQNINQNSDINSDPSNKQNNDQNANQETENNDQTKVKIPALSSTEQPPIQTANPDQQNRRSRSKSNVRNPNRKTPRDRMREIYRQLAKSCDMVESNGVDGEYMFRGERDIIVAYKNKEMEIYAMAKSENLPDKMITKKLGELREFVNAHLNELISTDNKFSPEKFS